MDDAVGGPDDLTADEAKMYRNLRMEHNRKNKKSGGFQAMGLSQPVFKGIMKKGYKVPTPIQRKSIPIIMDGRDVVAMARTGSGKTAAFVIPLLEKLKKHSSASTPRAIILSPTRELALQTFHFVRDLSRFTDITSTIILGGDRMEDQFEAIHQKPDILVATPGRLLHVLVEMSLKLSFIEYCVFDEADRLFEMGFEEQLREIIGRMPASRQTLMFSATLPKSIVEFAKGILNDPVLIRLDVESKLNEGLKLSYFSCREVDKTAVLLSLVRNFLKSDDLTVVFAATKHHVEYLKELLNAANVPATCLYSSLDPAARKINLEKFRRRKCNVLVVTDIAARGVDIPDLDNVINFHFPPKGKLFLHRVGRVARAGRAGQALSLIAPDELPYLLDLHLFLGRAFQIATSENRRDCDGMFGRFPQSLIDEEMDIIRPLHEKLEELRGMTTVCNNGYKKYLSTRPAASSESIGRVKKQYREATVAFHPLFSDKSSREEADRIAMLESIRSYKARSTIFEIGKNATSEAAETMRAKRGLHERTILKNQERRSTLPGTPAASAKKPVEEPSVEQLKEAFTDVMLNRPFAKIQERRRPKQEPFIPYSESNHHSEKGLEIEGTFMQQARSAMIEVNPDEADQMLKHSRQKKWDRKRKKFVGEDTSDPKKKKIRTESGVLIPATYKTNLYDTWKKLHQIDHVNKDESDEDAPSRPKTIHEANKILGAGRAKYRKSQIQSSQTAKDKRKFKLGRERRSDLRSKDEIAKTRQKKASQMARQKRRKDINENNRSKSIKAKK